jgi:hypothetical protein
MGVNRRGAVVAHDQDEALLYLAFRGELLPEPADRVIYACEGAVHRSGVASRLMSKAVHCRKLSEDEPGATFGRPE